MAVKFGTNQIKNPTPSKVNLWVRVYTVAAGIFLGWMPTTNLIGPIAAGNISGIVGLTLLLANGLAPLFGINLNGNEQKVDVQDVSSMDEPSTFSKPAAPNDKELNK